MKVSFELTMPNVASWNGRWSGEGKKYYKVRSFSGKEAKRIQTLIASNSYYYYNFGDGWGAGVSVNIVDAYEAKRRTKISAGFCGYEWMIDSIINNGKIIA